MAQVAPTFDTAHSATIHDAQLDYYGKLLASSSADHTIHLWDVSSDAPRFVSELRGHDGPVWQVSWAHPKYGNLLASCSYDRKIIIWREQAAGLWNPIYISDDHCSSVDTIQFAPWEFGLHLACGSADGTVSILSYNPDVGSWTRKAFSAHANGVLSVSWCPLAPSTMTTATASQSGLNVTPQTVTVKRLVTGGADHQVRVWNYIDATNEWMEAHEMSDKGHNSWVRDVAWRPNPGLSPFLVASCSDDGTVVLWQETDSHSWKNKQIIRMNEPVWKLSWSVTGAVLSVASGTNTVSLFKENLQGVWEPLSAATETISAVGTSAETASTPHPSCVSIPPGTFLKEYRQQQIDGAPQQAAAEQDQFGYRTSGQVLIRPESGSFRAQPHDQGFPVGYPQQIQAPPQQMQPHSQQMQAPPQQMQAPPQQMQAPPQQMQAPPQQMQAPPQQMQAPPQQMQAPPQQMQAPPQQMQAPPQQMQAPPQQMQAPPQQMQTPPQQMQPPSQQFDHQMATRSMNSNPHAFMQQGPPTNVGRPSKAPPHGQPSAGPPLTQHQQTPSQGFHYGHFSQQQGGFPPYSH